MECGIGMVVGVGRNMKYAQSLPRNLSFYQLNLKQTDASKTLGNEQ